MSDVRAEAIELRDAVVLYGAHPALTGASVRIGRGEIVLVEGANGSGKSTLLRACAGLKPLVRGEGRVLGFDLRHERAEVRRRTALLAHRDGLWADLTALENVQVWARLAGAAPDEAASALGRMGISGPLASRRVGSMSAGQKRRCALACVVVRRAEVWLLDEPHSALDAQGRDDLDALLVGARAAGATVVVASHDTERVAAYADRRIVLSGGRAA